MSRSYIGTKIEYVFHQTRFPCAIKRMGTRLRLSLDNINMRNFVHNALKSLITI